MSEPAKKILVFSHKAEVRDSIINAVGRRPAADLGKVTYIEAAAVADVIAEMDSGEIDLAIFDGRCCATIDPRWCATSPATCRRPMPCWFTHSTR